MSDSVLRSHIRALRQVLGADIIATSVGRGYRFTVDVHETNASTPAPVALPVAAATMRARSLVGRAAELSVLWSALEAARHGKRQLVFVNGESGVGKTALVDAFLDQVAGDRTVLRARGSCVEQYGSGEAYLPIFAALEDLCNRPGGGHTVDVLGKLAPSWLQQMPAVVHRHVPAGREPDPIPGTRAGMLHEAAQIIEALSIENPLVLALDDLHWSDPSTVDLVAFLARRREPNRLLLIGTLRPKELAKSHPLTRVLGELIAHKQVTSLPLETFSEETVRAYVEKRFPEHAFPPALTATIYRTTGGNPLFVVTLLDDLEDRQLIRESNGQWVLATTVEDVASRRPDSIRRLLDLQIDRLTPAEQRVVEAAAVAGSTFTAGVVAHALGIPLDEVDTYCESLANEHRFLRYLGTEAWPDGTIQSRYGFSHVLYQHAALARTPSVRVWHRRIAERLEVGFPGRTEAIAPELAEHFDEGHAFSRAAHYRALAGERAARRHGSYEALGHLERARMLIGRLPDGQERDELELRVLSSLGPCLLRTADVDSPHVVATFTRAAELASRFGRDEELCAALIGLQHWRLIRGELRAVTDHADDLARLAERIASPSLRNAAARLSSAAFFHRGCLSEAERRLAPLLSSVPSDHDAHSTLTFSARGALSLLVWLVGRPDEALELARSAVSASETLGDPYSLVLALSDLSKVSLWRGDSEGALRYARRAFDLAVEERYGRLRARLKLLVRRASADLDPSVASAHIEELRAEPWGASPTGRTLDSLAFVDICARAGQEALALETIADAMNDMDARDERYLEPELHRTRGELLVALGRREEAEQSFSIALDVARKQSSKSLELRAAMSLCRFHGNGSKRNAALTALRGLLASFPEGLASGDLLQARALLGA